MLSVKLATTVGVMVLISSSGVASQDSGTGAVLDLLLKLAGFGNKDPGLRRGICPPIMINKSSRLFYVENNGNDFVPGRPRHLRSVSGNKANIAQRRHLAPRPNANDRTSYPSYNDATKATQLRRHLVSKRATEVRPVTVDSYLDAYIYNDPTDGAGGHRCGNFCSDDKSCGFRRKCCKTPCGYACLQAVYSLNKTTPVKQNVQD